MIVIGLDTGSGKWHASVRNGERALLFVGQEKRPNTEHVDVRRQALAMQFAVFLTYVMEFPAKDDGGQVHVFCEEPLALQNGLTTRTLGLAAGAIWAQHLQHSIFWHWVDVASWQSMVGVSSRDKSETRKLKSKLYSIEAGMPEDKDEDHYDADNCALYGLRELAKLGA